MADNEQFIPMVRKHTELAKAVVVYIVAIIIIAVAVVPIFNGANDARRELESDKKELDALTNKVVILTGLDDAVLNQRLDVLNSILPPRKDIVSYLVTLDGLSRDLDLSLGSISLAPGDVSEATGSADSASSRNSRTGSLSSIETDISIDGEESDIYEFLRTIEDVAPLMQVKDVSVTKQEGLFLLRLRLGMLYSEDGVDSDLKGVVSLFTPEEERLYEQLQAFQRYSLEELPASQSTEGVGIENLFIPLELRLSGDLENLPQESTGSAQ